MPVEVRRGTRSSGAGVTGVCKTLGIGVRNWGSSAREAIALAC